MTLKTRATIDDLFRFKGKAELIDGEIVHMPATGGWPGYAADAAAHRTWPSPVTIHL
jgi:hypothetical protein